MMSRNDHVAEPFRSALNSAMTAPMLIAEPVTITLRGVVIEQLPMGCVGTDVEQMAEAYAEAHMDHSVCAWAMLRRAWIMGWRAMPFTGSAREYRRAYDAGMEARRERVLTDDANNEAQVWALDVGLRKPTRARLEAQFRAGYRACMDETPCPPGRPAFIGYRVALGAPAPTFAEVTR